MPGNLAGRDPHSSFHRSCGSENRENCPAILQLFFISIPKTEDYMKTWNSVRKQIDRTTLTSATWRSNRKYLLQIIDTAEMLNIVPPNASMSSLCTIVKSARDAIKAHNTRKLAELFRLAEVYPVHYLRVKCGRKLQPVCCCKADDDGTVNIQINLSQQQFEKFACTMKYRYSFEMS
jgi:hypothetical protein